MDESKVDHARINNTMGKMGYYLLTHNSICVGVSGGSDSNIIVHMIATYFRDSLPKVHFVFQNTGLEYKATLRHVEFMEDHYQIQIDRIKGESVPSVVRREGVPILSKEFSKLVRGCQKGQPWAIRRLERTKQESRYALSDKPKKMATYLISNGPMVSNACCDISKKRPYNKYLRQVHADLTISGERQSEGGQRATAHKDCFEQGDTVDKYMPLWYWNDDTKQYYKEAENIRYSDCYEVWGMTRTGCTGCPFNSKAGEDLKMIKKYEPLMYKACMAVFGESYRLMDKFNVHRHKILEDDDD